MAQPRHKYSVNTEVGIVKDLSGTSLEMVGLNGSVLELLPTPGRHAQYKVLIFGEGKVKGGVFEVDERELGPPIKKPKPPAEPRGPVIKTDGGCGGRHVA